MCNEIEEKINLCDHSIEHLYEFDFVPVNERQNENRYPLESTKAKTVGRYFSIFTLLYFVIGHNLVAECMCRHCMECVYVF